MDRFMQRRLQRLNTEQGFREQRQASLSQSQSQSQHSKPPLSSAQLSDLQQQQPLPQPSPPHHHHHQSSQAELHHSDLPLQSRVPVVNPDIPAPSTTSTTPSSSSTLSHSHLRHDPPQPSVYQPLRNFTKLHDDGPIHLSTANQPSSSMAPSNQNSASNTRKPSILSHNDAGRSTSQLKAEDLTEDEIRRLLSEHKELRKPTPPCLILKSLLTTRRARRKIPKGQKVLFRKGRPGQATAKQPRPPAHCPIPHLTRRWRVLGPLQPPRWPDCTTILQR
jgi:hypothetical protein